MNKNIKILLIAVLVLGAAYYLISRKPWGTFKTDQKDFAIEDTASLTKIFLADKQGNTVLLEKNAQNTWMVNNEYPADIQKINLMKATIHDIRVMAPLSEKAFNNVVSELATKGIKAEFYAGSKLIKTIYVGNATPDNAGTLMIIDGAKAPYATHIPGFVGYLTPRFNTTPIKWKDKLVFNASAAEIKTLNVQYPSDESLSFSIVNGASPVVKNISGKVLNPDPKFLAYYLSSFTGLYFEGFEENITKAQSDSIRSTRPFCIITLEDSKGKHELRVHLKAIDRRTKDRYNEKGEEIPYDTERYFAFVNNDRDVVYIQYFVFGKLFRRASEFAGPVL